MPKDRPEIDPDNLVASIRRRVKAVGGVDLELPPREPVREPPDFSWMLEDDNAVEILRERFSRLFRSTPQS